MMKLKGGANGRHGMESKAPQVMKMHTKDAIIRIRPEVVLKLQEKAPSCKSPCRMDSCLHGGAKRGNAAVVNRTPTGSTGLTRS